ncbi:MAG: M24 family metallopeptidase [Promethearchaeota archaeon]
MRIKEFHEKFISVCEAVVISDPKNIYYFTGFFPHSLSYLLIKNDLSLKLLVPELEYKDAKEHSKDTEIINLKDELPIDFLIKSIQEFNELKVLGFENEYMTVSTYLNLTQKLESIQFKGITEILNSIREVKTPKEIEYLEKAAQIADIGIKTAIENIEEGKIEKEIAGEVEYNMRKAGSEKIPFDTIIASGPNSALPHATASERKVQKGDLIIIDLGATYRGYCSDMTRTICFDKPSQKHLKIYNLVLTAHQEAIKVARAEIEAKEVDAIARNIIEQAGYEFIHSLGHGVGLDVHENPNISFKSKNKLIEHSIITIEPGIYIPGFGGVRIEDMYQVLNDKLKNLTKSKQDLCI